MSKARDLADLISTGGVLGDGVISASEITDITATASELNLLDGATVTTAELNKLAGTTATTSDFDKLSNVTASATELNYMTGATSSIQDQLDNISVTSGSLTKTFASGESATITLAQSISPAPVVSVTKEVAQTGQSSKGAWDVNATASNYDLHNTAYATTLTKSAVANANISDATYASKSFSTTTQDATPKAAFFKTDGTVMYVIGYNADYVSQYTLSTAWDVSTATYANKNFFVGTLETGPAALYITDDGLTGFYTGIVTDVIKKFTMSTAWDISTASDTSNTLNVNAQETSPRGIWFKPDGTKLYMTGANSYAVFEYGLSTAWDLTTASLTTNFNVGVQDNSPRGVTFNSTGTKMYVAGGTNSDIFQYTLSTAWDVSSASYDNVSLDITPQDVGLSDVFIGDNGTKIYATGDSNGAIYQYNNGTDALVLGTGSFASTDVGKRIQGNGGDVILTSTAGAYNTTGGSDFTDTSTISSGSWTMHGLKSAGASSGLTLAGKLDIYNLGSAAFDSSKSGELMTSGTQNGLAFNADGTYAYTCQGTLVYGFTLSTAYDISTAAQDGSYTVNLSAQATGLNSIIWNNDGTKFFVTNQVDPNGNVLEYSTASNPYQPQYASYTRSLGVTGRPRQLIFSPDGTKLFVASYDDYINEFTLTTGFDLSTATLVSNVNPFTTNPSFQAIQFNENGSELYLGARLAAEVIKIPLTTPYSLAGYTTNSIVYADQTVLLDVSATHADNLHHMLFADNGTKFYIVGASSTYRQIRYYTSGSGITIPTGSYNLAVTKPAGQIDSTYWTDINSMTADQSLGDGEAYYAVSTDDRTTWSVAKGSDGVRPIVRNNAGTWQYNSDAGNVVGWGVSSATYDSKSFSVASQDTEPQGIFIDSSGTRLYMAGPTNDSIYQYSLSTAWDISTASHVRTKSLAADDTAIRGVWFKSDGTKMYVGAAGGDDFIYEYHLTTAWDISTAGSIQANIAVTTAIGEQYVAGLYIKSDGTQIWSTGRGQDKVFGWTLTTAWDISTATSLQQLDVSTQTSTPNDIHFKSDGTELYVCSFGGTYSTHILTYTLSTAWDITTATFSSSLDVSSQSSSPQGLFIKDDGTKTYVVGGATYTIYQYSSNTTGFGTSTTWTNATTNDEFYALQQALGATSVNRMDKTQLDAVADGSHFTLGNTLDLMIALKQDTASASLPTSDGVTINYDAEALNQGAVLGTDYDFDFPANNKVRITSNAAQNLKIRVV